MAVLPKLTRNKEQSGGCDEAADVQKSLPVADRSAI
jgi:hypothetical protein